MNDAAVLGSWCEGDESKGAELLRRRIDDATVEQKLLTYGARGEAWALASFVERHLAGLDPATTRHLIGDGRLQRALAVFDDDLELLARWVAGNKGSADALFDRYYPVLDRFVTSKVGNAEEAADIVQDTFKDLTKQHRGIQRFRPFMFKVAANKVKRWFCSKYEAKVDTNVKGISNLPQSERHAPDACDEDHVDRKQLLLALQQLPLDQQMLLELYTWEEFSAPDVAAILGIQVHDVRHELRRAKQAMRDFLARSGEKAARDARTSALARFLDDLHDVAGDLKPAR